MTVLLSLSGSLTFSRPVYSLMLGTKPTIVLSSDVAIKDLLDKKGGIYSDRPDMFISQRVASGNHRLVVMVSDEFRRHPVMYYFVLGLSAAMHHQQGRFSKRSPRP
jgi:hypothetical protein